MMEMMITLQTNIMEFVADMVEFIALLMKTGVTACESGDLLVITLLTMLEVTLALWAMTFIVRSIKGMIKNS